ncbi:unknown [Clostridium sp. CAG:349]|nr:unknown [Clostridium sp. CAG:349]
MTKVVFASMPFADNRPTIPDSKTTTLSNRKINQLVLSSGFFLFAIFPSISVPPALLFVRREPPSATPEMTPPAIAEIIVRLLSMPEP